MLRRQGYRFQLKPTTSEESLLRQFMGCSRFVWNAILGENEACYLQGNPLPLHYPAFCARLKVLKAQYGFLREVHSQPLQQTLRDLASAYENAFNPTCTADMPRFKKKADSQGIRFPQGFKVERNGIFLPKIGWVAFRVSKRTGKKRKIEGAIKNVTVRLEAGRWYVSLQTEREVAATKHEKIDSAIGIDLGVARFAALSDGTFIDGANAFKTQSRKLASLQRRRARKVKFSANWHKTGARIARLHSRIANIRKDQLHKASAAISKNHAIVVLEDLRIADMTKAVASRIGTPGTHVAQKRGLNRRILDQGWSEFRRQLAYKVTWRFGTMLLVDPRNTSRTCSMCGHVSADNRLTQAMFKCISCGHSSNADTNAAKNILKRAGCARIACGDLSLDESAKQEAVCAA